MNSLDAIISMLFLLSCFGILLGTVVSQETRLENSKNSTITKSVVLRCIAIKDSEKANNSQTDDETNCYRKNGIIISEYRGIKKTAEFFDANMEEHYAKGNDFFD